MGIQAIIDIPRSHIELKVEISRDRGVVYPFHPTDFLL